MSTPQHSPELVEQLLDLLRQYIVSKRDRPRDSGLHVTNYRLVVEAYKALRPPPPPVEASPDLREPQWWQRYD